MYYNHNIQFLGAARAMEGRYSEAKRAAEELAANAAPGVREMPMLEFALSEPLFVELRSARWADALAPPAPDSSLPLTMALWHFGRGVAFAVTDRAKQAAEEREAFRKTRAQVPASAVFGGTGLNSASTILDIAGLVLDARIALARNDRDAAIESLEEAVSTQDRLIYDEPPAWYYPVRESLGAALLRDGKAVEAERVFRADLERNPNNGRSLFGLTRSLEAQRRAADADLVRTAFTRAWRNAEVELRVDDL
jgi:tetratricopeptide (TPR) repeat protein